MTETVHTVTDVPTPKKARFNKQKIAKVAAVTAVVGAGALWLRSKLNGSVEGQATVTVETDNKS